MGFLPESIQAELELLRISRKSVCYCRGDLEPQTLGDQTIAESADGKYDTEAAAENVHLATETSSPDLLLDLSALATLEVHKLLLERCCSMDD
jgi:hypothetical protein